MDQKTIKRWSVLGGLLGITLLLVWNMPAETPQDDADLNVVQPRRAATQRHAVPTALAAATNEFKLTPRPPAANEIADLFTILEVKPAATALVRPIAPTAPPLPFSFVGKMTEDGHEKLFLQEGETLLTVMSGDVVGRNYKILGFENGGVNVLYLPLNITQTIRAGGNKLPPRSPLNLDE